MLTHELIAGLEPRPREAARAAIWDAYADALVSPEAHALIGEAGMFEPGRPPHWLAQWAHESGGFTILWESLSYRTPERIVEIFGPGRHSAAIGLDEARRLVLRPEALGERVYGLGNPAKARELGNVASGDGFACRGFGIGQITGRRDHERLLCGDHTALGSIRAAVFEWTEKRCNEAADRDDLVTVTRRINGGLNGLAERRAYLVKARDVLAAMPIDAVTAPVARAERAWATEGAKARDPRDVRLGDSGDFVRQLQQLLARAGYPCGLDDGNFGPRTEAALASFQANAGLAARGTADALTWEALAAATPPPPRDVSVADLRARGSRQIAQWDILRRLGLWIKGATGGTAVGEVLGLQPVDRVLGLVEQSHGTVSRGARALGLALEPKWLALAALAAAGFALWKLATAGQAVRLGEAQSGANLTK